MSESRRKEDKTGFTSKSMSASNVCGHISCQLKSGLGSLVAVCIDMFIDTLSSTKCDFNPGGRLFE